MTATDITLLGTGRLGTALVRRWTAAGRTVTVWNRSAERAQRLAGTGVEVARDLEDAVATVPVVATVLADGEALTSVLIDGGAIRAMTAGSVLVDFSTVGVATSEEVAKEAAECGVQFVRVGVSGTAAVVEMGEAGLLVSGPAEARASVASVLVDVSANQVVVGEAEEARLVKLSTNLLLAGTMYLLAEAVAITEAAGVDRGVLLEALGSTVIASKFLAYKGAALEARNYDATFTTAAMRKDIALVVAQARASSVQVDVAEKLLAGLDEACDRGWAEDDFLSLMRLVQALAARRVDGTGS